MIKLRDARQNELSALGELCLRSKAVWGYDEAFLAACRAELTVRPDELLSTCLQVAERDSAVVGVAQVKITGIDADLLKLFVEPTRLCSGVGRLLFKWACNQAQSLGATRMTIEADPAATPFYERMGVRYAGFAPSHSIPGRVLPLMEIALRTSESTDDGRNDRARIGRGWL